MEMSERKARPPRELSTGPSIPETVSKQLFGVRPGLARVFKWFTFIGLICVLCLLITSIVRNRGNFLQVFHVTWPQFLFVTGIIALSILMARLAKKLPKGHPLSTQSFDAKDSGIYGRSIGIFSVVVFALMLSKNSIGSFYLRWGLAFLLIEVSQWLGIWFINRRRLTSMAA